MVVCVVVVACVLNNLSVQKNLVEPADERKLLIVMVMMIN